MIILSHLGAVNLPQAIALRGDEWELNSVVENYFGKSFFYKLELAGPSLGLLYILVPSTVTL